MLPYGAHLRLDDPWQGGGVWRASNPPGPYAALDPRVPYGLGWLDSQPGRPVPTDPQNSTREEPPEDTDDDTRGDTDDDFDDDRVASRPPTATCPGR